MKQLDNLDPCPLCEDKDTHSGRQYYDDLPVYYFATCEKCEILTVGDTEEEAINKWNNLRNFIKNKS
jgi:hypothetical protein